MFFGLRNNDAGPSGEPAIHPEDNAIHGLVEGTISSEMERSVRRVSFAASDTVDQSGNCLQRATTALKKRKDIWENGIYFVSLQMDVSA